MCKPLLNFHHQSTRGNFLSSLVCSTFTIALYPIVLDIPTHYTLFWLLRNTFVPPSAKKHSNFACLHWLRQHCRYIHSIYNAPNNITSDATDKAVGAVLEQFIDHEWRSIAFFSRKLRPAETRYSAFDRELLGIYLAIRRLGWFVEGRVFHIYTDHKPRH